MKSLIDGFYTREMQSVDKSEHDKCAGQAFRTNGIHSFSKHLQVFYHAK